MTAPVWRRAGRVPVAHFGRIHNSSLDQFEIPLDSLLNLVAVLQLQGAAVQPVWPSIVTVALDIPTRTRLATWFVLVTFLMSNTTCPTSLGAPAHLAQTTHRIREHTRGRQGIVTDAAVLGVWRSRVRIRKGPVS